MGRIENTTTKKVIVKDHRKCITPFQKARGLMFTWSMDKPLLFEFREEKMWGLHMICVFYPIDVIFLDKEKKVVDIKKNFLPWTFYTPKKPCAYIIEAPKETIKMSMTAVGDSIKF